MQNETLLLSGTPRHRRKLKTNVDKRPSCVPPKFWDVIHLQSSPVGSLFGKSSTQSLHGQLKNMELSEPEQRVIMDPLGVAQMNPAGKSSVKSVVDEESDPSTRTAVCLGTKAEVREHSPVAEVGHPAMAGSGHLNHNLDVSHDSLCEAVFRSQPPISPYVRRYCF